jgi:glycosyltransferase involved in cell wall biosynthesis
VRFTGAVGSEQVRKYIETSRAVVMPSVWYEAAPMMLVESFCAGRPAVVSRLGALAEIVSDRRTGLHFSAGDAGDLARALQQVVSDGELANQMGLQARNDYLERYTPVRNYAILQEIYDRALTRNGGSRDAVLNSATRATIV